MTDLTALPYPQLKSFLDKMRAERIAARDTPTYPHRTDSVPSSTDASRQITVHIYEPEGLKSGRQPAIINWHGSGFVMPCLGQDGPYCHWLSQKLGVRIIDADYAKAPELPFPACFQDAADVTKWVLQQPWCAPAIALSGFSAGGTLLIGLLAPSLAARYGITADESTAIKAGVAFYPLTGATTAERLAGPNVKDAKYLLEHDVPGMAFDEATLDLFSHCLLYGVDRSTLDGRYELSAKNAPASLWTGKAQTIVTCEYDSLEEEASTFARNLQKDGQDVVLLQTKQTSHAWESYVPVEEDKWTEDVKGGAAKKEAFQLVAKRIKQALDL